MRQALISIVHIIVIWNKSPKFRQLVTELYIEFDIDMVIRDVKSLKDRLSPAPFSHLLHKGNRYQDRQLIPLAQKNIQVTSTIINCDPFTQPNAKVGFYVLLGVRWKLSLLDNPISVALYTIGLVHAKALF